MIRCQVVLLTLAVLAPTAQAAPLTYAQAQELALQANPTVQTARRSLEQSGYDVLTAKGSFDPNLGLSGGWFQSLRRQLTQFSPDPFLIEANSWNADLSLDATAPSGTSGRLTAGVGGNVSAFRLNQTSGINLADLLGDSFDQVSFTPDFNLAVTQQLLKGVRLSYNLQSLRQARQAQTISQLQLQKTEQQVLSDVANAYWGWVYQEQLREISKAAVSLAQENLRIGIAKVDAGEAAPVERTRLQAALVQAQSSALDADNSAQQAADRLLLLLGREPGEAMEPMSRPGDVPDLELDVAKVREVAMQDSLDLRIARQQVEGAQLDVKDSRHDMWPSLSATVNAGLSGLDETLGGAFDLGETMFPNISVSGNFSVPLGNRAATGRARRSAVTLVEQQAALAEMERQIRAQVEQQVRLLVSAKQKVDLADANLRLAEETLSAEQALYDAGRSLLKDVLESRNEVDRSRAEAAKARTDFRVAEAELLRLQGRLQIAQ